MKYSLTEIKLKISVLIQIMFHFLIQNRLNNYTIPENFSEDQTTIHSPRTSSRKSSIDLGTEI